VRSWGGILGDLEACVVCIEGGMLNTRSVGYCCIKGMSFHGFLCLPGIIGFLLPILVFKGITHRLPLVRYSTELSSIPFSFKHLTNRRERCLDLTL
jgi:hypothetical protein